MPRDWVKEHHAGENAFSVGATCFASFAALLHTTIASG